MLKINFKMKHQSQKKFIISELLQNGFISRNYCLNLYSLGIRPSITKLNTMISYLKLHEGWEIETRKQLDDKGNEDYVYYKISSPQKKVVYRVPELNREITLFE